MNNMPNWNRIAQHYAKAPAEIHSIRDEWVMDPYAWDHDAGISLSPIEQALWHDIREADVVLYPQFPVGRFFVDFGNPAAKVAIECDGVQWHLDWHADSERQAAIEARGWKVYRIVGRDCFKVGSLTHDSDGIERWDAGPARSLIDRITRDHHIRRHRTRTNAQHATDGLIGWLDAQILKVT